MKKPNILLLILCVIFFIVSSIVNLRGTQDAHMLSLLSQDESIQYPYLTHMLEGGDSIFESIKNFVAYQHYFYGYPFYLVSAFTISPARLAYGADFANQVTLNLYLLRQFVSVIPMLLTIVLLVYLQTSFESLSRTFLLFLILVTIPAVTRNNLWFWHPDALALLGVVASIAFLVKDRFQFKKNFYLAAIAAGLSAGTKVIGAFLFLTVLAYLALGWHRRSIFSKQILKKAGIFLLLFLLVFLLSNPLLLVPRTREQILKIQAQQNKFVREGWTDDDVYQTGILSWLPYFEQWYAHPIILLFLLAATIYGIFSGRRRLANALLLTWLIPYSIYILFFVAVKPFHYPLPIMVPLFSSALNFLPESTYSRQRKRYLPFQIAAVGVVGILLVSNVYSSAKVFIEFYEEQDLLLACNSSAENELNGITVSLEEGKWYRVETYDLQSAPASRAYSVVEGPLQIQAEEDNGSIAWLCRNENAAFFSATRLARYFKRSNPDFLVYGPDGQPIK